LTKEELEQEADRVTRGETLLVQRTLTAPDGERRIFRIQLFPVPQSDDANQSFVVGRIGIDITEQFRIQEALKASEHEKSAILDCIAEGVVLLDLDHRIQWANSSVSQTLHKPLDEIIGKKCHQVWHNSMEPCSICPVMEARNSLSPAAHEIETPDGRIFLVHAAPILDSANKLSGAVETVLDITDIKRTENELRKSQEQLNLAMEGARLFSWDWHIQTGSDIRVRNCPRPSIRCFHWSIRRTFRASSMPSRNISRRNPGCSPSNSASGAKATITYG
jgi:PAS domain S-box-containing protein